MKQCQINSAKCPLDTLCKLYTFHTFRNNKVISSLTDLEAQRAKHFHFHVACWYPISWLSETKASLMNFLSWFILGIIFGGLVSLLPTILWKAKDLCVLKRNQSMSSSYFVSTWLPVLKPLLIKIAIDLFLIFSTPNSSKSFTRFWKQRCPMQ